MKKEISIWIDGPMISGRASFIMSILKNCHPPLDYSRDRDETLRWSFEYEIPIGIIDLNIAYSIDRTTLPLDRDRLGVEYDKFANSWSKAALNIKRSDAIIFVVNSVTVAHAMNLTAFNNLKSYIHAVGRKPEDIPVVFAFNKRDLPDIMSVEDLKRDLTWPMCDYQETVAAIGFYTDLALKRAIFLALKFRKNNPKVTKP